MNRLARVLIVLAALMGARVHLVGKTLDPVKVNVEVTNHCNQRCVLCPRLGFTRPLGFMARDVFEKVARECGVVHTPVLRSRVVRALVRR